MSANPFGADESIEEWAERHGLTNGTATLTKTARLPGVARIEPMQNTGLREVLDELLIQKGWQERQRFHEDDISFLVRQSGADPSRVRKVLREIRGRDVETAAPAAPTTHQEPVPAAPADADGYPALDLAPGSNMARVWDWVQSHRLNLRQQGTLEQRIECGRDLGLDSEQVSQAMKVLRRKLGIKSTPGGYRGAPPPRQTRAFREQYTEGTAEFPQPDAPAELADEERVTNAQPFRLSSDTEASARSLAVAIASELLLLAPDREALMMAARLVERCLS